MSIRFSKEALEDLLQIGETIKTYSEISACRITRELTEACWALNDMPMRYPLVPNYEDHGIRRRPLGEYLIFYAVTDDVVSIVHILHGARDYERLLFPDN